MGKKKHKSESNEETYRMITLEDVRAREIKYGHRVEALKHCLYYLEDMLLQLEVLNEENRLHENWLAYLRCDGLPKPYLPPDIRLFFEKLRFFEAENIEKNIDWTLSVDNRSILTQNIFRIDRTRETVKLEKLPDFGGEYEKNIDLALKVLKSIEYYLADEKMYSQAKPRILDDIKEQKKSVYNEISAFIDRYSYRVLCSEDAYMENIDARTAEYFYSGKNFQIHIWTIKNVPIIFEFLDDPYMIANLHCLNVRINIPFDTLDDNLTIRGIHFEFDHLSESAKSYDQVIPEASKNLNAGITDLRDCLVNEWKKQVELQLDIRNKMVQTRLEYEELKKQFEEEEAQRAKDKKKDEGKDKKKPKVIKLPKEPPNLRDNEVPDTWADFLKNEQKEFEDFLKDVYHPNLLKLESHEINLKKYLILGGVYQFDFVSKARHFDFTSNFFNMTWHENDGKLLIKNVKIKLQRTSTRESERRRTSILSGASVYDPEISPWFVIRMTLPEYLCLWGEPLPCHFEAEAIGFLEEEKGPDVNLVHTGKSRRGHSHSIHTPQSPQFAAQSQEINSIASFLRDSIHSLTMQADRRTSVMRLAATVMAELGDSPVGDLYNMGIEDFDLNFPLTKNEIRCLERHCLPRIISSYKFPAEFTAEAKERSAKAKSAGGTLIRRHSIHQIDERASTVKIDKERTFTTLQQHNPERLFPAFPSLDELKFRRVLSDQPEDIPPTTFYELIKRLDSIKRYYMGRITRITMQPSFKPNLRLLKPLTKPVLISDKRLTDRGRRSSRMVTSHPSATSVVSRIQKDQRRKTTETIKLPERLSAVPDDKEEEEEEIELNVGVLSARGSSNISLHDKKIFKFSRWTTRHIRHTEFDREKKTLTIWTDRLGTIGLAYKRYEHLPFRFWSLEPSEENPDNEVIFTLETQYAKVVLYITGDGIRGYVTDLEKKFVRNRPMYLVIEEPLKDFRELRKRFREKNLNIFTDRDASFYIENGYFSQKHLATEMHTYCVMCTHAQTMRFLYSEWNRLASRRNLLLRLIHHKESEEYMCTVRITPEESTFVTVKELCSDDLDVFNLEYTSTWRNIDFYADLDHLIASIYPSASDQRVKNPHLIYFLKAILWEIRPLSFS